MVLVHQIQIRSNGFPGAPGFTTLHFDASLPTFDLPQYDAVKAWLDAVKGIFPVIWSAAIEPAGRVLDEVTGELSSFTGVDATNGAVVTGTGAAGFGAGVAGAVTALSTNTVNRSRKVRGRIFTVPLTSNAYDINGTLTPDVQTILTTAATVLMEAGVGFGVWSRPINGAGGLLGQVTAVRVADRAAFLSSRRI